MKNKTIKEIFDIVSKSATHVVFPKQETPIEYEVSVSYTNSVDTTKVSGKLKSVILSNEDTDALITFEIENERGTMYVDYYTKGDYTCLYYHFTNDGDEEYNETLDKNTPLKVLRTILSSIR